MALIALSASIAFGAPWVGMVDDGIRMPIYALRGMTAAGFLTPFLSLITHIGDQLSIIAVAAVVVVILLATRNWKLAVFFAVAFAVGFVLASALKVVIARPRPQGYNLIALPTSASFPSGHSILSVLLYSLIAMLLNLWAGTKFKGIWHTRFIVFVLVLLCVCVGFSRLYLGVHWPTDVLGGWLLGLAVALPAYYILARYHKKLMRR
jgi:undecaprenyl-diphosphatase